MIIHVRGAHGSGKSTVVRQVLAYYDHTPIYGLLGLGMPEAYECELPGGQALYVLGPYESPATAGGDYITKKGVGVTADVLRAYAAKGHVLFESAMTSCRFLGPSVGQFWVEHRSDTVHVSLTTSEDECLLAVQRRRQHSVSSVGSSKHLARQQRDFSAVSRKLIADGFRVEYASREEAVVRVIQLLEQRDV